MDDGDMSDGEGTSQQAKRFSEIMDRSLYRGITIKCTNAHCKKQINVNFPNEYGKHPRLNILVCKKCWRFLNRHKWTKDADGEEESCTWCGRDQNDLYLCDKCKTHAFCDACLKHHFGREYLLKAENNKDWACFVCNPVAIKNFRDDYDAIVGGVKRQPSGRRRSSALDSSRGHQRGLSFLNVKEEEEDIKPPTLENTARVDVEILRDMLFQSMQSSHQFNGDVKKLFNELKSTIRRTDIDAKTKASKAAAIWESYKNVIIKLKEHCVASKTVLSRDIRSNDDHRERTPATEAAPSSRKRRLSSPKRHQPKRQCTTEEGELSNGAEPEIEVLPSHNDENSNDDIADNISEAAEIRSVETIPISPGQLVDADVPNELHQNDADSPISHSSITKAAESRDVAQLEPARVFTFRHLEREPPINENSDLSTMDDNDGATKLKAEPADYYSEDDFMSCAGSPETKYDSIEDVDKEMEVMEEGTPQDQNQPTDEIHGPNGGPKTRSENNHSNEEILDPEMEKELDELRRVSNATLRALAPIKVGNTSTSTKDNKENIQPKERPDGGIDSSRNDVDNTEKQSQDSDDGSSDDDIDDQDEAPRMLQPPPVPPFQLLQPNSPVGGHVGSCETSSSSDESDDRESKFDNDDEDEPKYSPSTKKGKPVIRSVEDDLVLIESSDLDENDNEDSRVEGRTEQQREMDRLCRMPAVPRSPEIRKIGKPPTGDGCSRSKSTIRRRFQRISTSSEDESSTDLEYNDEKPVSDSDSEYADSLVSDRVNTPPTVRNIEAIVNSPQESLMRSSGKANTRRNIRPIMAGSEETQLAEAAERERLARLQSKAVSTIVPSRQPVAADVTPIILDPTAEPVVEIDHALVPHLKEHQANGVRFLYDNTIESIGKKDTPPGGCILAHCMGLGKTLQVIAYLRAVFRPDLGCRTAIVAAPVNVVLNWKAEFDKWLTDDSIRVWKLSSNVRIQERIQIIRNWHDGGGVLIIGYQLLSILTNEIIRAPDDSTLTEEQKFLKTCLLSPGPDVVVCDEAHILKNPKTNVHASIMAMATKRRICLTGTPLQNHLTEYYYMVKIVKPSLLGSLPEFRNRFENPIKNGQLFNSTANDVSLMKKRSHVLHSLLEGSINRVDYSVLEKDLPPRHEYVLMVRMTEMQARLYESYLQNMVGNVDNESLQRRKMLFTDFDVFMRICGHPMALKIRMQKQTVVGRPVEGALENIDICSDDLGDSDDDANSVCDQDGDRPGPSGINGAGSKPNQSQTQAMPENSMWWTSLVGESELVKLENSGKMILLMEILWRSEQKGDKVIVFSQSLDILDSIEELLSHYPSFIEQYHNTSDQDKAHSAKRKLLGWAWNLGSDYVRFDGKTNVNKRKQFIAMFNSPSKPRCRLFLISTKAGGLGINLVAGNRVVIFDATWNPANDSQAVFRAYRYGQTKPVFIYRLIAQGTMEHVIYNRQVNKSSLSLRVIDEQQIGRHYSDSDVEALYNFHRDGDSGGGGRSMAMEVAVPKDDVLADLLLDQKQYLAIYQDHNSLLKDLEAEKLTEEEKRVAWAEYKADRESQASSSQQPTHWYQTDPRFNCLIQITSDVIQQAGGTGRADLLTACVFPFMSTMVRLASAPYPRAGFPNGHTSNN